jgi:hypothetical protein
MGSGYGGSAIQNEACFALRFGFVHGRDLSAIGFTLKAAFLGSFNASDAAPALAGLGVYEAHLLLGMMRSAVVAKGCFRHASSLGLIARVESLTFLESKLQNHGDTKLAGKALNQ